MANIKIEWLSDSYDCETCGGSYAEGAVVYIDGILVLDLTPQAHCFGGDDYGTAEVYERIIKHLGHDLTDNSA